MAITFHLIQFNNSVSVTNYLQTHIHTHLTRQRHSRFKHCHCRAASRSNWKK